jgi:ATPase subunit of ABC transporter with duplicated ATPase domains
MSIGYLPQEGLALTGRTVFEECLTVFDELHEMEREIERLSGQLSELDHAGPEYEAAAERYSMLQERFHALDGYALDAQVGGVLTGLGFGKEGAARPMSSAAAGRCASRWPNCCWPNRIFSFSTSPPTTWTWKLATGSKIISGLIPSVTS